MTLDALADTLPNGFHDVQIGSIRLDFSNGSMVLEMSLDVTVMRDKPCYRMATVTVTGLRSVALGALESERTPFDGPLAASGYSVTQYKALPESMKSPDLKDLLYSFYLEDLNSCIYLAANHAEISWSEPDPSV